MYGMVESIKVSIGDERNDVLKPEESVAVIDCKPTTRSRDISGSR